MKKLDYLDKKPEAVCDTECYIDYWSIGFKNRANGKYVIIEKYDGHELDCPRIVKILRSFRIIGFNTKKYDEQMIALALSGASNALLKQASDDLIQHEMMPWTFEEKYGVTFRRSIDIIDLWDVSPGKWVSLKKYGARLNAKRLQELPIIHTERVGAARRPLMRSYLGNDLDTTELLADNLNTEMELRAEMSVENGIDLRSKSDAQIAEALFKLEFKKRTKRDLKKPNIRRETFKYTPPDYVAFETQYMRDILKHVRRADFVVGANGYVTAPSMAKFKFNVGGLDFTMGIGGLHSCEEKRYFESTDDMVIVDEDVRGYYPAMMLACGISPVSIPLSIFQPVFKGFVSRRDLAKLEGERLTNLGIKSEVAGDLIQKSLYDEKAAPFIKVSGSLKIVNNGTFGQTGNPHSVLSGPRMMVQTTLTGQLSIAMLIERVDVAGFKVISANTDGITCLVDRKRKWLFDSIVFDWECETQLIMEQKEYKGLYTCNVNSYFAVPMKGKIKKKGQYGGASLQDKHDPNCDICSTAAIEWVVNGTPIEDTIDACEDITKFLRVQEVKEGGAQKDGNYLGRLCRWYYGKGATGAITKVDDGARVANSTGATPCMDLPDEFPNDIDYAWYIREAYARLADVGINARDPNKPRPTGYAYATQPALKTVHIFDRYNDESLCGRRNNDVRDVWDELDEEPAKVCKKCDAARSAKHIVVDTYDDAFNYEDDGL